MLVRPFFLPPSSGPGGIGADVDNAATVAAELLPSPSANGLAGDLVGLDPAFWEARRFLGFGGDGGRVERVVAPVVG